MGYFLSPKDESLRPAYFTPWGFIHLRSGILMYLFFSLLRMDTVSNFALSLTIHTLYEIKDIFIMRYTVENSIGDTIMFVAGFWLAWVFLEGTPVDWNKRVFLLLGILTLINACIYRVEDLG